MAPWELLPRPALLALLSLPYTGAVRAAAPSWQLTVPLRRHAPPQLALAPAAPGSRGLQKEEAVRFVPSFKAAHRAHGVVHGADDSTEYVVTPRASRVEIRAMLNGLCETGQLEPAISVLSQRLSTAERGDTEGLVSIVLNACADAGRMDMTRNMLRIMRECEVPIGLLTFCILIKGHGRAGDVARVQRTYATMRQMQLAPDLATLNALLDAYARNGRLAEAESVLGDMRKYGVEPSARTYNTLIKGYSSAGQMRDAFAVVRRMRTELGPRGPNEVTYSTLIHACVRGGQLHRARQILAWMAEPSNPLTPDVWAYTALMRGLLADTRGGDDHVSEALALLDEMLSARVRPNAATVSTLINGCFDRGNVSAARLVGHAVSAHAAAAGDARLARAAEEAMIVGLCRPLYQYGSEQYTSALASASDSASAASALQEETGRARDTLRLRDALRLFVSCVSSDDEGGSSNKRRLGTRTCNALLAALVAEGEVTSAGKVLQAMEDGSSEPANAYSYCIMMAAYGSRRQLRQAEQLWKRLWEQGWVDTVALNAWIQVCVSNGEMRRALQAFQNTKAEQPNLVLDKVTFGTLINGLTRAHGEFAKRATARRALQLWAEMRVLGLAPDDGIVASLFGASCRHLGVDVALRLRVELVRLGWGQAQLRPHDRLLLDALPSLAEVMQEPDKWEALGVTLPTSLRSEQAELSLTLPPVGEEDPSAPQALAAATSRQSFEESSSKRRSALSTEARRRLNEEQSDEDEDEEDDVRPATAGEEIWERHAWNSADSSFRPFFWGTPPW